MPGKGYGVHGCSNIADLNTGVSLHSSPVLKAAKRKRAIFILFMQT